MEVGASIHGQQAAAYSHHHNALLAKYWELGGGVSKSYLMVAHSMWRTVVKKFVLEVDGEEKCITLSEAVEFKSGRTCPSGGTQCFPT